MSVDFDSSKQRWRVRWREQRRQRARMFSTQEEAHAFDESHRAEVEPTGRGLTIVERAGGDAIYAYSTKAGVRYRFAFRQSGGTLSTRRGFTSRRAAATARRRLVESIERGELKVARESFETFWLRLLEERRPYMTKGSAEDFETHGRKRLLPSLGATPLARVDEQLVRRWMDEMVALVESGELAPKTVNNARTCLSVALNDAQRRGLLSRNPCTAVPALPVDRARVLRIRSRAQDGCFSAVLSARRRRPKCHPPADDSATSGVHDLLTERFAWHRVRQEDRMYRQRRAVERIVTMEVMRLERRQSIDRGDIADAPARAGRHRSDREGVRRLSPRPSPG